MSRLAALFRRVLVVSMAPLLGLGPMAHPYVNRLALRKAKKKRETDPRLNKDLLDLLCEHEEEFVNAGNSADAISTYHVLNDIDLYDYAHNYDPDNVTGVPQFGYALLAEWDRNRAEYRPQHGAVAAGWLSHQLADWYAHYVYVRPDGTPDDNRREIAKETGFNGLANAMSVFGNDLPPELRRRHKDPNHALFEFFLDLLVLNLPETGWLSQTRVNLFDHEDKSRIPLLTLCSERFDGRIRIPPEHLLSLEQDFNAVIIGTELFGRLLLRAYPRLPAALKSVVGPGILGLSVNRIYRDLFCKSWDEIRGQACMTSPRRRDTGKIESLRSERLSTPGSSLFAVLYHLGASLKGLPTREEVAAAIAEPVRTIGPRLPAGVGAVGRAVDWLMEKAGSDLDVLLYRLLRQQLQKIGGKSKGRWKELSPVISFLSGLLLESGGDLKAARATMREYLRPLIIVPEVESLCDMFSRGHITLTAVPALAQSYSGELREQKRLDRDSLLVRVDGYPLEKSAMGQLKVSEGSAGELQVAITLKQEPQPGVHHLFVDIRDCGDVHAEYIDHRIEVPEKEYGRGGAADPEAPDQPRIAGS